MGQMAKIGRNIFSLVLLLLAPLSASSQRAGFSDAYFNIGPIYDDFGSEVDGSQILEMVDMRSTNLGLGSGSDYSHLRGPRVQESPAPLLPREQYPGQRAGRSGSLKTPRTYTDIYTPQFRFKRQTRYRPVQKPDIDRYPTNRRVHQEPTFPDSSLFQLGGSIEPLPSPRSNSEPQPKVCDPDPPMKCDPRMPYRMMDGSCNNLERPKWGATNQAMRRLLPAEYFDGFDVPRVTSKSDPRRLLPSPRLVSRIVHEPAAVRGHNAHEVTNFLQIWGQFLDHDITGTPALKGPSNSDIKCCDGISLSENQQIHKDAYEGGPCHPIYIPPNDRHFTRSCMNFVRSIPAKRGRDCNKDAPREVRQQMSMLTAWIDASQIYGSTKQAADAIRLFRQGLLRVGDGELLPEDVNSTCVKEEPGDYCFLAGDRRVNEHPGLMALHTVVLRYHNRVASQLARINPRWADERIYQETRRIVGAVLQHIVYHDWLPIILGPSIMRQYSLNVLSAHAEGPSYWKYDKSTEPTILNAFATAAFRFGHSIVPSFFTLGDKEHRLYTMFNRPKFILRNRGQGLQHMCAGMMSDPAHYSDRFVTTDLSDRLFEDKMNISLDLPSLNIQRGRDHGLPPYTEYRKLCGLPVFRTFEELFEQEPERAKVFKRAYTHVDDIDLFSGGLSEKILPEAMVGPTFACILARQFHALKFADRFWYENPDGVGAFRPEQLAEIRRITSSRLICTSSAMRNAPVNPFYRDGIFMPRGVTLLNGDHITQNRYVPCDDLPDLDLRKWRENGAQ